MRVRMEFTGGDEIRKRLAMLDDAVSREVSTSALMAGAEPIRQAASRLCPRGPGAGPHLADQIAAAPVEPGQGPKGRTAVTVGIGVPKEFFYDLFVEFGTKRVRRRSFYRPALDSEHAAALELINAAYWQAIAEKAAK
jgi:HK97 gp10 family phage protein